MSCLKLWLVDAFTAEPFRGNPAGVCIVDDFLDDDLMQSIAAELNWSETSFVKSITSNHFHIRWFSPKDEAPLCGHATLAASHILWQQKIVQESVITFDSLGGPLVAERSLDGWITLNFPLKEIAPCALPEDLRIALGDVRIESVFKDDLIYVVVLSDPLEVINLNPNLSLIESLPCRAVTVTAKGLEPYDFISRYFAPKVGIPEDPVCGSAHCRLTPFWGQILGKRNMYAYQASKRSGILKVSFDDERVSLSSKAVTVCEGYLNIDISQQLAKVVNS